MYCKFYKFYKAPKWQIIGAYNVKINEPAIKGKFDAKFNAISLAKKGYYGGNPSLILKEDFNVILDILEYENFCSQYETALYELNKNNK